MWLSRFGRTVAGHVVEAVSGRLSDPLSGAQVTVGGQSVDLSRADGEGTVAEALTGLARALGAGSGPAPEADEGPGAWRDRRDGAWDDPAGAGSARRVTGRELLLGSAFHVASDGGKAGGPGFAAWGRVTTGGFDGEDEADDGAVRMDGEVTTGILGADAAWGRWLAGVAVSLSEGEGSYSYSEVGRGRIESSLTSVNPYARLDVTERVSTWVLLGYGTGEMTMTEAATESRPREAGGRRPTSRCGSVRSARVARCFRVTRRAASMSRCGRTRSLHGPSGTKSPTRGTPRRMRAGCASSWKAAARSRSARARC